jgi:UDP-N-acetylmuramate dehydrogenase
MTIEEGVELAALTTLGTGGPARALARPETEADVEEALRWAAERDLPVATVGLGSNLLAADDGVDALVLKLAGSLAAVAVEGDVIRAGGGAANAVALHRARAAGLGGFEFACAIPGTIGGGVWMNGGAYGGEFSEVLERVRIVSADGSGWFTPADLGLSYRHSDLRHGQVVVEAELRLSPRDPAKIKATVRELNARRKAAQPTNRRTFGSVFKNPEHELSAGRMLEACGLKAHRIGGAQISPKHANFIENAGGARTADALALMAEARRRAHEQYGVELRHEVELLGAVELPPLAWGRHRPRRRPAGGRPASTHAGQITARPRGGRVLAARAQGSRVGAGARTVRAVGPLAPRRPQPARGRRRCLCDCARDRRLCDRPCGGRRCAERSPGAGAAGGGTAARLEPDGRRRRRARAQCRVTADGSLRPLRSRLPAHASHQRRAGDAGRRRPPR